MTCRFRFCVYVGMSVFIHIYIYICVLTLRARESSKTRRHFLVIKGFISWAVKDEEGDFLSFEVSRDIEVVIWFFGAFCASLPEGQPSRVAAQAASQAILELISEEALHGSEPQPASIPLQPANLVFTSLHD